MYNPSVCSAEYSVEGSGYSNSLAPLSAFRPCLSPEPQPLLLRHKKPHDFGRDGNRREHGRWVLIEPCHHSIYECAEITGSLRAPPKCQELVGNLYQYWGWARTQLPRYYPALCEAFLVLHFRTILMISQGEQESKHDPAQPRASSMGLSHTYCNYYTISRVVPLAHWSGVRTRRRVT